MKSSPDSTAADAIGVPPASRGWAVITGATSGIGAAFADALAGLGHPLLITGRRVEQLEQIAESCRTRYGVQVRSLKVELSSPADRKSLLAATAGCTPVDVVVANAGFGFSDSFVSGPIEPVLGMIDVHVSSVVELFHQVLPQMIARRHGVLIAVSSLASLIPVPDSESYVASKSYLNSFCESLHLRVIDHSVVVQALLPGFTRTDFHRYDPRFAQRQPASTRLRWMTPEAVVAASLRSLKKRHPFCIPGFSNRVIASIVTMLPRRLLRSLIRRAVRTRTAAR